MIAWGCSSNGRAPASHAGGKGIDAPLLHHFFANAIHDARVGQRVTLHSIPINASVIYKGFLRWRDLFFLVNQNNQNLFCCLFAVRSMNL